MDRLTHTAEHVIIRDHGLHVEAVWTADPATAEQLRTGDTATYNRLILDHTLDIEMVGNLRRIYKADGHTQSGWLLHTGPSGTDYVGTRKREALAALRVSIADYFQAGE